MRQFFFSRNSGRDMEITVKREGTFCSYTKEEDGARQVFHCRDIRGSMVWPTLTSPAYFCIFAQQNDLNVHGKLPLVLLSEGQDTLPHKFFQEMIAKAKQYRCRQFYVDFQKENREVINLFNDICRYSRVTFIALKRAPFGSNFSLGLGLTRQWAADGALEIPDGSIMRSQLSAISAEDLTQQGIEERFYALRTLFYIIGSVEKSPWQLEEFVSKQGQSRGYFWG
jgi:hypothetical protein